MKRVIILVAGFFFLESSVGQPWAHVGDYKTQALCESAFTHTIQVHGLGSAWNYEMQSTTDPNTVVDPAQTTEFRCFHEN